MSLKLYYGPGACSFVPHAMLEATGSAFEPVLVKLHKNEQNSPEYLALNPRGQVPVLVDGEQVISQIVAIISYLDAQFPAQHFVPQEPLARARFFEQLAWMNNSVHPTFTHVFMPFKYTDQPDAQQALRAFNTAQYRQRLLELQQLVQQATQRGHAALAGEHFGPLDAYALTLTRWGTIAGINPEDLPELWAYVQRVALWPAAARAIERERLQLNLYQPAK